MGKKKTPAATRACENENNLKNNIVKTLQNQTSIERLERVQAALDRFLERTEGGRG